MSKKTRTQSTNQLPVHVRPGDNPDRVLAEIVATGIVGNAFTMKTFGAGTFGELNLAECVAALKASTDGVQQRDTKSAESMLMAQATALNAVFGELARRAAINMGEYMDACERYMRLALKAQSQCRVTLETLANIQNPPVVFARQANIAHGPQQVNNECRLAGGGATTPQASAPEASQPHKVSVLDPLPDACARVMETPAREATQT